MLIFALIFNLPYEIILFSFLRDAVFGFSSDVIYGLDIFYTSISLIVFLLTFKFRRKIRFFDLGHVKKSN